METGSLGKVRAGESMEERKWIYQIRGIAIIAVVVCHQQWILHKSEVIQLLSLYSVTTLIFLMGVTKAISLKNHYFGKDHCEKIFRYSLKSMAPTACAYIVATVFYSYRQLGEIDFNSIWSSTLSFSASHPFYFMQHYFWLSLWAPLFFSVIKSILIKGIPQIEKNIQLLFIYILIWLIGYGTIGRLDIFGQSYLFVYSVGLLVGQMEGREAKRIYIIPAILIFLTGLISTKKFYWARVEGVTDYSEGINFLAPKLQMNPPNISIIIYSFGVIWIAYLFFESIKNYIYIKWIGDLFCICGKYSLDIFLWHLYIQQILNQYASMMKNNVLKWIIYYGSMLLIPIAVRKIYSQIKKRVYRILTAGLS